MLRAVNKHQAHFIALLAKVARMQRDKLLGNVAEDDLGGTKSSRGEHNPTAVLGFEPLPPDAEQLTALREAIGSLTADGRAELHVLMRIGLGDLAAQDWNRGLDEAALLGEQAVGALLDDARRWVVERTFAWLNRNHRLAKDLEGQPGKRSRMVIPCQRQTTLT